MYLEHRGRRPSIHPSAYIAPTAVVSGDVHVGPGTRVLFGAILTSEGGPVRVGSNSIIMEGALIRGSRRHPVTIDDHVLVGPRAYLTGCTIHSEVFLATGATIFNGAVVESRAEVRIKGVVHVNTRVPPDAVVPIGWIAVGNPAQIFPPDQHARIWEIQESLDFPGTVFGLPRRESGMSIMRKLTRRYAQALGIHRHDVVLAGPEGHPEGEANADPEAP